MVCVKHDTSKRRLRLGRITLFYHHFGCIEVSQQERCIFQNTEELLTRYCIKLFLLFLMDHFLIPESEIPRNTNACIKTVWNYTQDNLFSSQLS